MIQFQMHKCYFSLQKCAPVHIRQSRHQYKQITAISLTAPSLSSISTLTTALSVNPLDGIHSACVSIQHSDNSSLLKQNQRACLLTHCTKYASIHARLSCAVETNTDSSLYSREQTYSATCGSYRATELHVPKAIVPPRPQETTFGVLFAQQATWHVSNTDAAILEAGVVVALL